MVRTKEKKTLTVDWTPKGLAHNFTEESSMKTWMMAMLVVVASGVGGSAIASQDQRPLTVIVQVKVLPGMESAFETAVRVASSFPEEMLRDCGYKTRKASGGSFRGGKPARHKIPLPAVAFERLAHSISAAGFCRSTCLVFQASVAAIRAKALIKRISVSNISTEIGKKIPCCL